MFFRKILTLIVLMIACMELHAQTGFPDHCGAAPLPFAPIEVRHPIDSSCGLRGAPGAPANSQLQNTVKNNFCAGAGNRQPEVVTVQSLVDLQRQTTVPSGHGREPASRAPLQVLGEGKLVRIKAFVYEGHHADLGSGESVNCLGLTELDNDVHIALVAQATDQECQSVTAEISPHFRPDSWDVIGHDETYTASTRLYTPDPTIEAKLKGHPFRITGQLFFDASHKVCPCGVNCTPVRASLWEIHPVYAIEVCAPGTPCDENRDADWIAFDRWWAGNPAPGPTPVRRPPHTHAPHEGRPHTHAPTPTPG
jgi:hypothetical protein